MSLKRRRPARFNPGHCGPASFNPNTIGILSVRFDMAGRDMDGKTIERAIARGLWATIKRRGYGAIRATERRLGWPADSLRGARNRASGFRVREVADTLAALDVPPGAFFADIFGGRAAVHDRFRAEGAELAARFPVVLPRMAKRLRPDCLSAEDLERLDAARFEDPDHAAELAAGIGRSAARDGRQGDAAAAVARQGSALRISGELDGAHACLWWALEAASPGSAIAADVWLRTGSVVSDRGDFADAAELAARAVLAHAELGDLAGMGRALVSRSMFLQRDEDFDAAIPGYLAALSYLPLGDRNRFAAHQHLGLAYLAKDSLVAAAEHADFASEIGAPVPEAAAHLLWLRAKIASVVEDHTSAIERYGDALAGPLSPVDRALASAELCRVYLLAGRPWETLEHARNMVAIIPVNGNRIVAAALLDLVRSVMAGELTLRKIERVIRRIEEARRARKTPRPAKAR